MGHPGTGPPPACPFPPTPLAKPRGDAAPGASREGDAQCGGSPRLMPPPTHLENLEEPPVPGLPPPLAVVQGAEGGGEDAQGGLPGGEQGLVLLTYEGPWWLSGVGTP